MIEFVAHQVVEVLKQEAAAYYAENGLPQLPDDWLTVSNDSQNAIHFKLNDDNAFYKIECDYKLNKYHLHVVIVNAEMCLHHEENMWYIKPIEAIEYIAASIVNLIECQSEE